MVPIGSVPLCAAVGGAIRTRSPGHRRLDDLLLAYRLHALAPAPTLRVDKILAEPLAQHAADDPMIGLHVVEAAH